MCFIIRIPGDFWSQCSLLSEHIGRNLTINSPEVVRMLLLWLCGKPIWYIIYIYIYIVIVSSDVLEHKWRASLKLHYC